MNEKLVRVLPGQRSLPNDAIPAESASEAPRRVRPNTQRPRLARRIAAASWSSPARKAWSVIIFLAGWQIVGSLLNSLFLPPVSKVLHSLVDMLGTSTLWSSIGSTLEIWALSALLSFVIGTLLGLVAGFWFIGDSLLGPIIDFLNAVPAVAFLPLWIVWSGTSRITDVTFAMVLAMPAAAYNVRDGAQSADPLLSDMVRSFGGSRLQTIRFVQFFAALPLALAGMRVTAGRCFIGVIVSQEILTGSSIGELVSNYGGAFDTQQLWALNLIILAMAFGFGELFTMVERVTLRGRFVQKDA